MTDRQTDRTANLLYEYVAVLTRHTQIKVKVKVKVKERIVLSELRDATCHWDHTVLPATRRR